MSFSVTKLDPGADLNNYFYSDISGGGYPDPNIKATAIKDNFLYMVYGNSSAEYAMAHAAKIDLSTYKIQEYSPVQDNDNSNAVYTDDAGLGNIDVPINNKAFLWGNIIVTAIRTASPYNGITLIKIDLDTDTVVFRSLTNVNIDTYILDLAIDQNDFYIIGKTGVDTEYYNKIYKVDLSTHDETGCPTTEYTINSVLRGNQTSYIYNNKIYFFGGEYYNSETNLIEFLSNKYFTINIPDILDPDCLNEENLLPNVAMPPVVGNVALIADGSKIHIPDNPYLYTVNISDGSVYKTTTAEVVSGNISHLYNSMIIILDFSTGTIYQVDEPESSNLVAYGIIQFFDAEEPDAIIEDLYYNKLSNKIDDKKLIDKRELL